MAIVLAATAAIGCSESDTTTAPTVLKCQVSLALKQGPMGSSGGAGAVTVTTQPECAWTAGSEAPWITGVTPTSGQGSGEVQFQVAANPTATPREGTIVLNDIRAVVTQPGAACAISISPSSQDVAAGGGNGTVAVTAPNGCAWTASSNAGWLAVTSGANGSGSGSVGFSAAANAGATRTGSIAIGEQSFVVTQLEVGALPACQFTIQPTTLSIAATAGTSPISVQAAAGCAWTSTSQATWITFSGASGGTGNGGVTISATANSGGSRTGTVTIAGRTLTVTQAAAGSPACTYTIQPTTLSIAATAGTTPIGVQAGAGCAWTSTSNATWITFSGASGGTGNGTVTISAAANTGVSRNGTVTIAGQTLTVTQAGCAISLNAAAQTVAATGGNGTPIGVTAPAGCGWTSAASQTWITVTSGASGSGNGTVNFTVSANTGPLRTATVTVGGQVHTVTQSSGCTYQLSSSSLSLGKNQSTGRTVTVTAGAGCTWTATSNANWITITSGASGTGNGTVVFDVARNETGDNRVGTLTIAGLTFTVNQND